MKLSILLVTYNQEKYIQECLDGLVMQKTPFEYEIIVADDFSTDNTLNIIKENLERKKMNHTVLLSHQNLGFNKNYKRGYLACKGEYIAILEGDDYWTSPDRLINHVTFLDNHRECVLSFNQHILLFEQNSKFIVPEWISANDFEYISANDLALGNKLGNLSTCVIRHSILNKMNEKLMDMGFADWFLGLFLGQFGLLAKQKDITSVYRIHSKGLWSGNADNDLNQRMLDAIEEYNKCLEFKYDAEFSKLKLQYTSTQTRERKINYSKIKYFIPPIFIWGIKLFIPIKLLVYVKKKLKK